MLHGKGTSDMECGRQSGAVQLAVCQQPRTRRCWWNRLQPVVTQ